MIIIHRPGSPKYEILVRQLTVRDLTSNSWTVHILLILHRYNLPSALTLVTNPSKKRLWKRMVKSTVAARRGITDENSRVPRVNLDV